MADPCQLPPWHSPSKGNVLLQPELAVRCLDVTPETQKSEEPEPMQPTALPCSFTPQIPQTLNLTTTNLNLPNLGSPPPCPADIGAARIRLITNNFIYTFM